MNNKIGKITSGFTLIELLVVVLIIGILAAIALPMYQKAVLKSRFSALMPIAKALAESNEVYYLEHGNYTEDLAALPIQGKDATSETYSDGTELEASAEGNYNYVMAFRQDFPNRYVVYQTHSRYFAGDTHCEALSSDTRAQEVCQSLGGREIGTNGAYKVYLLSGGSTGVFPGVLINKECSGTVCTYTYSDDTSVRMNTEDRNMDFELTSNTSMSVYLRSFCKLDQHGTCTEEVRYGDAGRDCTKQTCAIQYQNDDGTFTQFFYNDGELVNFRVSDSYITSGFLGGGFMGSYLATYDANGKLFKVEMPTSIGADFGTTVDYDSEGNCTGGSCSNPILSEISHSYNISNYQESDFINTSICELYPDACAQ